MMSLPGLRIQGLADGVSLSGPRCLISRVLCAALCHAGILTLRNQTGLRQNPGLVRGDLGLRGLAEVPAGRPACSSPWRWQRGTSAVG
jgi:hypothetical protein